MQHGANVDLKDAVVDLSQDATRGAWRLHGSPTQTTSSEFYLCGKGRVCYPEEYMMLLGFDVDRLNLDNLTPSQVKDLAAESMSPPTVATCMVALLDAMFRARQ